MVLEMASHPTKAAWSGHLCGHHSEQIRSGGAWLVQNEDTSKGSVAVLMFCLLRTECPGRD